MAKGRDWTPEQDALVLDFVPKKKTASAAVRLGRNISAVERRYLDLTTGKRTRPPRSGSLKTYEDCQRERVQMVVAQKKANQG